MPYDCLTSNKFFQGERLLASENSTEPVRGQGVLPDLIPACMTPIVDGCEWTQNSTGDSGAKVYHLVGSGSRRFYLKHGRGSVAHDVTDELVRLRWLTDKIAVPKVCHFVASRDEAWLLTEALPGLTAYQALGADLADRGAMVDALADFLRRFHALPVDACPFNGNYRLRLLQAEDRMSAGLVDTDDFDHERAGWTAAQVWDDMISLLPFTPDPVVTHGDLSLHNILIDSGQIVGLVDVARLGTADRYQDLAILCDGLHEFDDTLQQRLLRAYGIEAVDERKLRFHQALDEFF
jgi:aminoglycoside 3'-phosphotransferase-1